jgi:hypothetical protein
VFAFAKSARQLRYDGLDVSFRPMPATDRSLSEFLAALPEGTVIALSIPALHAEGFMSSGVRLDAIGAAGVHDLPRSSHVAILGVRGARRGAIVRSSGAALKAEVAAGDSIGETGIRAASAIGVDVNESEATIRHGSRDIARSSDGVALATWRPDGRLDRAFILEADDGYRVPIPAGALSVYPLRGLMAAQELHANRWTDVTPSASSGTTMLRVAPGAVVMLCAGDDRPLAPRVIGRSSDRASVEVSFVEDTRSMREKFGLEDDTLARFERTPFVYTVRVAAQGPQPVSVILGWGGVSTHAIGRTLGSGSPAVASAFRVDTGELLRTVDRNSELLLMVRDDQAQLTGSGWSAVDADAVSAYRWMTDREARLLLPVASAGVSRIRIQALRDHASEPTTVSLRLNGTPLPPLRLVTGWHTYEWTVPDGILRQGANESAVIVDASPSVGTTSKGIAVSEVRVVYRPAR